MPSAGQTTDCLTVTRWHKAVGDYVARGDILLEVETDKATLYVESFAAGILLKICVNEGDTAFVGDVLAYIGDATDKIEPEEPLVSNITPDSKMTESFDDDYVPICPQGNRTLPMQRTPLLAPQKILGNEKKTAPAPKIPETLRASPAAKKAARDAHIGWAEIPAGQSGILKKADVQRYLRGAAVETDDYSLIPLTAMRKTIAAVMMQSVSTIPSYTVEVEVDMTKLLELRKCLLEQGHKAAIHDVLVKCTAQAIADYPLINASYTEAGIRQYRKVNVGIAVSVDRGLLVPVLRDTGGKSLFEIASESAVLIEKARNGRLQQSDMQGGTITISNLGAFGIRRFTAIINPPESCILAVGSVEKRKQIASITATFDHRLIDGAYGAAFLTSLRKHIENPEGTL